MSDDKFSAIEIKAFEFIDSHYLDSIQCAGFRNDLINLLITVTELQKQGCYESIIATGIATSITPDEIQVIRTAIRKAEIKR